MIPVWFDVCRGSRTIARISALGLAIAALCASVRAGTSLPPFCFGDGALGSFCPCSPLIVGGPDRGCPNSFNAAGALLTTSGFGPAVSFNTHIGGNSAAFALMLKGSAIENQVFASGDGLRCVGGQLIRFGGHNAGTAGAPLGSWTYPNTVQTTLVSVATGQPSGLPAYYQLYYRNLAANFCNPSTTNLSNGVGVQW